jgi:hypothetical protein
MAEDTSKIAVTTEKTAPSELRPARRPLEGLRQEIDRLFDDFGIGTWRSPFRSSFFDFDEPKLHLAVCRQWTSPKQRRATR